MSPDNFIEGIRDLLHQRAVQGDEPAASDLGNILRQVEAVFNGMTQPGEETPEDLRKTVEDLHKTVEDLQGELEEAEQERDKSQAKVKELQTKVERYGDDPDVGRAAEVERLRTLLQDSAIGFDTIANKLSQPRPRKEHVIAAAVRHAAEIRAEVGEGDDE